MIDTRGQLQRSLPRGDRIEYTLPLIDSDDIEIILYTVPFFPIYKGKATKIGVSIDGSKSKNANKLTDEYGKSWKDQVLRNGAVARLKFKIDTSNRHIPSLLFVEMLV